LCTTFDPKWKEKGTQIARTQRKANLQRCRSSFLGNKKKGGEISSNYQIFEGLPSYSYNRLYSLSATIMGSNFNWARRSFWRNQTHFIHKSTASAHKHFQLGRLTFLSRKDECFIRIKGFVTHWIYIQSFFNSQTRRFIFENLLEKGYIGSLWQKCVHNTWYYVL
jgi:hypothetical protein